MNSNTISLIKQLIQIPSEPYNREACEELLAVIKKRLSGFSCREFHSNGVSSVLYSNRNNEQSTFKLLFNAHLDVVPGKKDQYNPVIENGKLYGRGSIDMKSSAACMVDAFEEYSRKVTYPLGLQLVTDEEVGGEDGTNFQIQKGINAEFVLGGEISDFQINNEAKGVLLIRIKVNGKSSHSAYPWDGENAAVKMGEVIYKLHKIFPIPENESWETTASVIKIETENNSVNTIPDNCSVLVNIRYIPEEDRDIIGLLEKSLPENTQIEVVFRVPPEYTSKDNPYVVRLAESIGKVTQRAATFLKTHGQSDLRYYHMIKTPGVNFSPIGGNHHANEEWVDIQSVEEYYQVLSIFLTSLD